jgi:peptide/nickel transport system permease protein
LSTLYRYVGRRLLEIVPLVFAVVAINFVLVHLAPGDPALFLAGENSNSEQLAAIRHKYGFDQPIYMQFATYLALLLRGDLGYSYFQSKTVLQLILERLPATLLLVFPAYTLGILLGTLIGVFAAKKYPGKTDTVVSLSSMAAYSAPTFWLGMLLILIFARDLRIFPSFGITSLTAEKQGLEYALDIGWHLFLPVVTLMAWCLPTFVRLARASTIEVMREDFMLTARAKGLSDNVIFFKHALRNSLLPTVTTAGLYMGMIFSGAILTETVFAWPGMDLLLYHSIATRDYPVMSGIFMFTTLCVALAMLITDIVCALLDPRVVLK